MSEWIVSCYLRSRLCHLYKFKDEQSARKFQKEFLKQVTDCMDKIINGNDYIRFTKFNDDIWLDPSDIVSVTVGKIGDQNGKSASGYL